MGTAEWIYLVTNGFGMYGRYRFLRIFLHEERVPEVWIRWGYVAFFLLNSAGHLLLGNPVVNLLDTFLMYLLLAFLYEASIGKRVFLVIINCVISMLIDSFVYFILTASGIPKNELGTWSFIPAFLMFFIVLILEQWWQEKETRELKGAHWFCISLLPLGGIVITAAAHFTIPQTEVQLLIMTILFLINGVTFYLFDELGQSYAEKYRLELLTQQNYAYVRQYQELKKESDQIQILRHDLKNHISAMQNLQKANQKQKAEGYMERFVQALKETEPLVHTGNLDIDSILNYKLQRLQEIQADIELNIQIPADWQVDLFDFTILLGNLLDNAAEALSDCALPRIFYLSMELERGVCYLHMKNSCDRQPKVQGGRLLTGKKEKERHGLGLQSVKQLVDKYEGEMTLDWKDGFFETSVMLFLKEREEDLDGRKDF